ncbi:MAG: hypothetical protein M1824_004391 [Vezdaea acicularis]|nr:MAG: hypothetical protein M1824_004391 [Vezdaea acicularis]
MKLSFTCVPLLCAALVAAKPCQKRGTLSPSPSPSPFPSSSTSTPAATPGIQSIGGGTTKCPAGFLNVVFNGAASTQGDWNARWSTLQANGISDWIGFTLDNNPKAGASLNAGQIRVVMDPRNIAEATTLLTSPNPPPYLEIFNEPDFSFGDATPTTDPTTAAKAITPLLAALQKSTTTQLLSPAPAYPQSSYLPSFFAACNCADRFPIITAHIYSPTAQGAIDKIQAVHAQFPSKKLWLTELAPASDPSQGCTLDAAGMTSWMQTVLSFAAGSGYVEKIFWNCGENGVIYPDNPGQCNPSLTNVDGSATPLLSAMKGFCGGGGGAVGPLPSAAVS